jgi:glycosyltransferase involved in cell wall biosynthesis
MRKRVLLVSTVHPATDPRIVCKIAASLKADYEVFCALPDAKDQNMNGLVSISLPTASRLLERILRCHPVMLWKCVRLRPDIVHIFLPELIPAAFIFKWLGAGIVYEVQENLFKKFSIKQFNNHAIYQAFFKYFDRLARKEFHLIFTENAYLQEYRQLAKPYAIVRNFVSLPVIDSIPGNESPVSARYEFLYVGVVSIERCLDTLLLAMAELKSKYADFHVHIFGTLRVNMREIRTLEGYAQVSEHITFYGYQDQKVALGFARRCIAGIALLKPVADYPDSYTTKLFEYMALGLPVITSDFSLYRQVVEQSECGFCISPYNAGALSEKLTWLIENEDARIEMGRNGRKSAEIRYNWTTEKSALLSIYKSIA